jgi:hypothetical protein
VEAFHRLGVHNVESLILVDALFLLDGGRKREGKKREKKKENYCIFLMILFMSILATCIFFWSFTHSNA